MQQGHWAVIITLEYAWDYYFAHSRGAEYCYNFSVMIETPPNFDKLDCGPMPNVMTALPNIGDALCSTPQSLAGAHY